MDGKIAALRGPVIVDRTPFRPEKKTTLIRIFFKHQMFPIQKKTMRFHELINVHLKAYGKTIGIPGSKIDKTRLTTAGVASPALEVFHNRKRDSFLGTGDSF